MEYFVSKKRSRNFSLILFFFLVILVIGFAIYNLFLTPAPVIEGIDAFNFLSIDKTITLNGKNLKSIDISINQESKTISLLSDIPVSSERKYELQIKPKELDLMDGSATVIINIKSGIFKKVKHKINSIIDTVPPALKVLRAPLTVHEGSGGVALLKAKEANSVFITLIETNQLGEDLTFRAFKSASESDSKSLQISKGGASTFVVFFPVPLGSKVDSIFYAVAEDRAGNQNIKALPIKLKKKRFKTSTINIGDFFINKVISPLLNEMNISDPVSAFKNVNEDWRKSNRKTLIEIAQKTEPKILWKGRFVQLKNSKVMARYGERRTYLYKGKLISESAHLGYDLASVKKAMVTAANSGVVRFAGELGIYGNTVIIDHGLGLMSLYGHLSTMIVKEGSRVEKGEVIAHTGATGLAGGDHLHFGILIHGYEVSPLYWWDSHWVKVNVLDYLE